MARLHGQAFSDTGLWLGMLAVGLASGVVAPPLTFLPLFNFLETLFLLRRLLAEPDEDRQELQQRAQRLALTYCLRIYRGVPDLERAGVCYTKDVIYLRGLRMIEHAVAQDETILDRLAVGKIALEHLPDLQELGIVAPPQSMRTLTDHPDLDSYILSFEQVEEHPHQLI